MIDAWYGVRMINIDFYPLLGGAQMHTLRLCRFLRANGVDAQVITRHHPGLARHEVIEGVPVHRTPIWHLSRAPRDLSRAVTSGCFTFYALSQLAQERHAVQIVHSHEMLSPMTIGLLSSNLLGTRLVINPHRGGYLGDVYKLQHNRRLTGGARMRQARACGDAFIAISSEIAAELRAIGVPSRKIRHIPCALETDHFCPAHAEARDGVRQELGLDEGVWACFSGRLVEEKGVDRLLQAWVQVTGEVPDARLLILGDGPERGTLELLTRELGLNGRVRFAGRVDDTLPYLQACDAYAQPSFTEGLPISVLEAMACELGVVATDVGGITDLVRDGQNGMVVGPGDVQALGTRLAQLLGDAEMRRALGVQARRDVVAYCALERVGEAHLVLYEELLADTRGRRGGR